MARNGTEFGIRLSGTGDAWFTAPAPVVDGLYLGAFTAEDANPDIGDSAITETVGLGGFAMAASPAIVGFVGGTASGAVQRTLAMYEITLTEHPDYKIPILESRGTPTGIDAARVVRTGILPVINTGSPARNPASAWWAPESSTLPWPVSPQRCRHWQRSAQMSEERVMATEVAR